MLGGIIAVLIAIWFYRSALSMGENPWVWAINGVIVYYLIVMLWTFLVARPLMPKAHSQHAVLIAALLGYSANVLGLLMAWYIRSRLMANAAKGKLGHKT